MNASRLPLSAKAGYLNSQRGLRIAWCLLLCLVLSPLNLLANERLVLNLEQQEYPLGPLLELAVDESLTWNIEQVSSALWVDKFKATGEETPNLGFIKGACWVRLTIQNPMPKTEEMILHYAFSRMKFIELYVPSEEGGFEVSKAGAAYPFSFREIPYHEFAFRLTLPALQAKTFYLRFESPQSATRLPMTLRTPNNFIHYTNTYSQILGIYYGLMLFIGVINLGIFVFIRDRSYLYYVITEVFTILTFGLLNGVIYQYIFPENPEFFNHFGYLIIGMFFLFSTLFTQSFLATKQHQPKLHRALTLFTGINVSVWIILSLFSNLFLIRSGIVLMCIHSLLMFATGIHSWRQGMRSANYYVIAWSSFLVGIILLALDRSGLLPSVFITNHGAQLGSTIEEIILAIALADRIHLMNQEKNLAMAQALTAEESNRESQTLSLRLELELQTAKAVQELLIPKENLNSNDFQFASFYQPASATGGDWYDHYFYEDTNEVHILIGDVTGHGASAALITAIVHGFTTTIRHCQPYFEPAYAVQMRLPPLQLKVLNDIFYNTTRGLYHMTFFYAILELKSKKLIYTSGGHPPCLIYRKNSWPSVKPGNSFPHIRELRTNNSYLGRANANEFVSSVESMHSGDVIVWYTDGLIENQNPLQKPYSLRRLKTILNKYASLSAEEIKNKIVEEVTQFYDTQPKEDDITLVVVKIN